jgi:hypothetical protein
MSCNLAHPDGEALTAELPGERCHALARTSSALWPHEESYVAPGKKKPPAEIAAERAGPDDENAHVTALPVRRP